jgi:hypothetical protein
MRALKMSIRSTGLSDHETALPGALAADQVYSFDEFAKLAGISTQTLRRMIQSGTGPVVTWMSARRGGVRGRHGTAWLDSRAVQPAA